MDFISGIHLALLYLSFFLTAQAAGKGVGVAAPS